MSAPNRPAPRDRAAEQTKPLTLSTEQAAAALHIRPQTLRAALCRDGHYFGVRPIKLRNRFLAWKAEDIERLLNGEEAAS